MSLKRNPNPRPRIPALLLALMLSWGVSAGLGVAHAEDTFPIIKRMAVSSAK